MSVKGSLSWSLWKARWSAVRERCAPDYSGGMSGLVVAAQPPLPCGHSQVIRVPRGSIRVIANLA
jgi:hypothetical protein